jgi:hypothetical protein
MDPYYFPFQIVNKDSLIPGENYYIKLNDRITKDFLTKNRNLPVSHLKGTFVRLHIELDKVTNIEYAIFKNVVILNHNYKMGLCNQMMIRYPEGFLASTGCDSYSDNNRKINHDREVFFNIKTWIFGKPIEQELITKQVLNTTKPVLNKDVISVIGQFRGTNKGGKKTRRIKSMSGKKRRIYRRRKTNKRF